MLLIFSLVHHDFISSSKSRNSGVRPEGSYKLPPLSQVPELFQFLSHSKASLTFWWIHKDDQTSHLEIVSMSVYCVCVRVDMYEIGDFGIVPLDQLS